MRLHANTTAFRADRLRRQNNNNRSESAERLASGYRINRASDDPAGLAISEQMKTRTRGLEQNARNIQDGKSLLDTADGAMGEMQDAAHRMRELTVQAANDTLTESNREEIKQEMKELEAHMDTAARETQFNEIPLLDGSLSQKTEDVADEKSPDLQVPDDGTEVSESLELGEFEVEFRFEKLAGDELKIELWSEGTRIGSEVMTDDPIEWEETAGGSELDLGADVVHTDDGGFVAVGTTSSADGDIDSGEVEGEESIFAVKYDSNGEMEWSETYQSDVRAEGVSISDLPTEDGYLISGHTGTEGGDSDKILLKIEEDGEESFQETYGGQNDYGKSIHNVEDGGKILANEIEANHGHKDILLLKVDQDGIYKWEKHIENTESDDIAYDVKIDDDGNYVVAGQQGDDAVLHKIDSQDDSVTTDEMDFAGEMREIEPLDDGGYIAAGYNSDNNELEVRMLDENLDIDETYSTAAELPYEGDISIEEDGDEFVVSITQEADDGSQEINAIKLDDELGEEWQSSDYDAGSHGNAGGEIYSNTEGGYLVTDGDLDNRLVQFDQRGIYQGEIDLAEFEGGEYEDYEIEQIVSGEENYYSLLRNDDSWQLAEIDYTADGFEADHMNVEDVSENFADSQEFTELHLLNEGASGLVVETSDGEDTVLERFDGDLNHQSSVEAADEYETVNDVIETEVDNLAVVGESQRGEVTASVTDDNELYQDLELNFTDGADSEGGETVSFDRDNNMLEIDLHFDTDYTPEDIQEILADNYNSADVTTNYGDEDLNSYIEDMLEEDADFSDEASAENITIEVDGDDISTLDLDGKTLSLEEDEEGRAVGKIVDEDFDLSATGITAFVEEDEITIEDDSEEVDIDETISFDGNGDWSIDPDENDNVYDQAEEVADIIDDQLDGHAAELSNENGENVIEIEEIEGEATGTDIDIAAEGNAEIEFSTEVDSVEEVLGEYQFEISDKFSDGVSIEIEGESFLYHSDEDIGDFSGDNQEAQAESLAEVIDEEMEYWDAEVEEDSSGVNLTEAEDATGADLEEADISIIEPEGDVGEVEEQQESLEEELGDYDIEITYAYEADDTLSFEYNDQEWDINFVENGNNGEYEIDVSEHDTVGDQAEEIREILEDDLEEHVVSVEGDTIEVEETSPADGQNLSVTEDEDNQGNLELNTITESSESQTGEYEFDIIEAFTDGNRIELDDESFEYHGDENLGDFTGDDQEAQAESLAEAISDRMDRWEASADGDTITLEENEDEVTGEELAVLVPEASGGYDEFDVNTESQEEVQGEYELTLNSNEDYYGKEINFDVEEELEPEEESAEIIEENAEETLQFNLADDIDLREFELASNAAFESEGENWADGENLQLTDDNGEYAGSEFYVNGLSNLRLAEFDEDGDESTVEVYGGSGAENGYQILENGEGGYFIAGHTKSTDGDLEDIGEEGSWFMELNEDFEIEWQETLEDTTVEEITHLESGENDEIYMFGLDSDEELWVGSVDLNEDNGDPTIETLHDNENNFPEGFNIVQLEDGGFSISGTDSDDLNLLTMDEGENIDLNTTLEKDSTASGVTKAADGGAVLSENKEIIGEDKDNGTLKKIDDEGKLIWEEEVLPDEEAIISDVQETDDGELIVTGSMADSDDVFAAELDSDGSTNWSETYEGLSSLQIDEADDGDYIITGHREMQNQNEVYDYDQDDTEEIYDMSVLKVDEDNGDTIWRHDYGADDEFAGNAFSTEADGFLTVGTKTSYTNPKYSENDGYDPDKDAVIMKTDNDGNWQWDLDLGEDDLDAEGVYIQDSFDSTGTLDGHIMTYTQETEDGGQDVSAVKFSEENGEPEIEWQETFENEGEDTVGNIINTEDGGFVLTGSREEDGNSDLWTLKLDEDGSEEWQQTYGGSGDDYGEYIDQTEDGGYIITGSTDSEDLPNDLKGERDQLLVRLDSEGNLQWSDLIGGSGEDEGRTIREFSDREYIMTGDTSSDDGDVESWGEELDESAMWTVNYSRAFDTENIEPEEAPEQLAPYGTGEIFLELDEAEVEFDWDQSEVTGISAEGVERTDSKFGVQVGPDSSEKIFTEIENVTTKALGFEEGWLDGDFSDEEFVNETLETIDGAIDQLSSARSELGAFTNRLEHSLSNVENYRENIEAARSRIEDVDVAKEMLRQTRTAIIDQAVTSMLAQANAQPQTVLQLLNTGTG